MADNLVIHCMRACCSAANGWQGPAICTAKCRCAGSVGQSAHCCGACRHTRRAAAPCMHETALKLMLKLGLRDADSRSNTALHTCGFSAAHQRLTVPTLRLIQQCVLPNAATPTAAPTKEPADSPYAVGVCRQQLGAYMSTVAVQHDVECAGGRRCCALQPGSLVSIEQIRPT